MVDDLLAQLLGSIRSLAQCAARPDLIVIMGRAPYHLTPEVDIEAARMKMGLIFVPRAPRVGASPWAFASSASSSESQGSSTTMPCRSALAGSGLRGADAVRTIIQAWEQVGQRVVKSAWRCTLPAEGGE
jgi:hypothetical protein